VVIAALVTSGDDLERLLRSQPSDQSPLAVLRVTLQQFPGNYQDHDPRAWKILDLIQTTPRLRAPFLLERDSWLPRIATVLIELGMEAREAKSAAAVSLGLLTVAYERWHRDRTTDVQLLVSEACDEIERFIERRRE
jgi:hypothetical protein